MADADRNPTYLRELEGRVAEFWAAFVSFLSPARSSSAWRWSTPGGTLSRRWVGTTRRPHRPVT